MAEIKLTQQQRAVVNHGNGALLVSAAAGSGKTKVLIDRVLRRVTEDGCNVDDFLMITFTQAAAAELRGKLITAMSEALAEHPEKHGLQKQMGRVYLAQISTVHAFCASVLREYAHRLGLPSDFTVCDEQEAESLRQRVMDALMENLFTRLDDEPELAEALNVLGAGRDEKRLRELIEKVCSGLQSFPKPRERLDEFRRMLELEDCDDAGETVWGAYLLDEFRQYAEQCAETLRDLCAQIGRCEALEKYQATFGANLATVESLAAVKSWEELRAQKPDFGRLTAIRNCTEPELQARVQAGRKGVIDGLRQRLGRFALSSPEALEELKKSRPAILGLLRLTEDFSAAYRSEKLRRHCLDYNDLEHEMLRLLTDGGLSSAAAELSRRYTEIMVDEYQDTNAVQEAIFDAISRKGENLFFVGDVKQSIYRFRMADPSIFLKKYREFPDEEHAEKNAPSRILLSDNFRSVPAILSAANDVFRLTMTERVGGLYYTDREALRANRKMPDYGEPAVELHCIELPAGERPVERAEQEAEFVARRIARMLHDGETISDGDTLRPIRAEDIVILMRSLSGKAGHYMAALRRCGVACVCGSDDIFATEEIGFLTALLQVLDNPRQDIPLLTVLLSPVFAFSADELARLRAKSRREEIWDILNGSEHGSRFREQIAAFRNAARRVSMRELLEQLNDATGMRNIYGAMDGGEQRRKNFDTFFALADAYESRGRYGLSGFVRYLLTLREKGFTEEDGGTVGAVRLMTVHKSKGLEFPVVFLADLCKGFNLTDAYDTVLTDPMLGIGCNLFDRQTAVSYPTIARTAIADRTKKESVSEEMRVLYVAMTRARERLIMTCCDRNMAGKLKKTASELTLPIREPMIESADSFADWILMAALTRLEAGELFAAGGNPEIGAVSEYPWRIAYHEELPPAIAANETVTEAMPLLPLRYRPYPYPTATEMPTKLTATQLKGRTLLSDDAPEPTELPLRLPKPRFETGERLLSPTERGTAIHLAMQFIRYECCTDLAGVKRELERLTEKKFITPQQAAAVEPERIVRLFASPLGRRIQNAPKLVREFKFSVLEDAARYDPSLRGETVLLQGVTDCCLMEAEGLVIVDFKSDRIRAGEEGLRGEHYRGQLEAYSRALGRIFNLPVKERILYFFATGGEISL